MYSELKKTWVTAFSMVANSSLTVFLPAVFIFYVLKISLNPYHALGGNPVLQGNVAFLKQ